MRVGIDVTPLQAVETGVDRYLLQLVHSLARIDSRNHYTVFTNLEDTGRFAGLGHNFSLRRTGVRGRPSRFVAQQLIVPVLARSLGLDVLHSPSFFIPVWRGRAKHLLTVFDMTMFTRPECHTRFRRSRLFLHGLVKSIHRSHHIVVPSHFVRQEITRLLPDVDPGKITVTPLGIDPEFQPGGPAHRTLPGDLAGCLPYLLYVGTIEPRKNLSMLLEAYLKAIRKHGLRESLLLAGRKGWNYGTVERLLQSDELRHRTRLLGYVAREDLIGLYQNASAFIYPSLEEGFGLPPLEAMACGIPTIATVTSSLEENLRGAALLVRADDSDALADALGDVLNQPEMRARLTECGLARARQFSWDMTARKTLECYDALI